MILMLALVVFLLLALLLLGLEFLRELAALDFDLELSDTLAARRRLPSD